MATPAEIVTAIDAFMLTFVSTGAKQQVRFYDHEFQITTAGDLMKIRSEYAALAANELAVSSGLNPLQMHGVKYRKPGEGT